MSLVRIPVRPGLPAMIVLGWILFRAAAPTPLSAQVGGNLAAFPPVELELEIVSESDGPRLSPERFELVTGEYYRLSISADGEPDWRLDLSDLIQNSHLRIVTIDGIEVHLQGMTFRALEFDEAGTARLSFTPIRPGTYQFFVSDVPSAYGGPIGSVGLPDDAVAAFGVFEVE